MKVAEFLHPESMVATDVLRATRENRTTYWEGAQLKTLGRILLLEDEPFIALDMEEMLREFGASEIVTFDMRSEAMEWLASNRPDLAVVDPRLNDGICIDVVEKLSAEGVPFAVYSGVGMHDDDGAAFARGLWLTKPTTPEMVKKTLERLANP